MTAAPISRPEIALLPTRHLLSVADMDRSALEVLLQRADELRVMPAVRRREILQGALVATLFYEPSTRTRLSFEAASLRLGAQVVSSENARDNSSAKKGERLEDVFRVVGSYVDAIVLRHHEAHTMAEAAPFSPVPVINAGAGDGEHPTQAVLDIYTMYRELGGVDGLTVAVLGDLRYGRTVHSLLRLLTRFHGVNVILCHPRSLGLPSGLFEELQADGLSLRSEDSVAAALAEADVVYQTRIQRERMADTDDLGDAERFRIGLTALQGMKRTARILHPLPRVDEIDAAVDKDPRAAYFRQAENGLYVRMAILEQLIKGEVACV